MFISALFCERLVMSRLQVVTVLLALSGVAVVAGVGAQTPQQPSTPAPATVVLTPLAPLVSAPATSSAARTAGEPIVAPIKRVHPSHVAKEGKGSKAKRNSNAKRDTARAKGKKARAPGGIPLAAPTRLVIVSPTRLANRPGMARAARARAAFEGVFPY